MKKHKFADFRPSLTWAQVPGGAGFRCFHLARSLLTGDKWGNWIISKEYNASMLADQRRAHTTKRVRETEAEAVSFAVCSGIGLEAGTAAQDYIQLYEGDAKLLKESLEHIQQTATRILNAIGAEDTSAPIASGWLIVCPRFVRHLGQIELNFHWRPSGLYKEHDTFFALGNRGLAGSRGFCKAENNRSG